MVLLKNRILSILLILIFSLMSYVSFADDFRFNNKVGAMGLSVFELEMRESFLSDFCRHDKENHGQDVFQCLMNNGRPLGAEQREIMLAIPGNELRNGFFDRFEREALEEINFEKELAKTPTGMELLQLYMQSKNEIRIKVFYHVERSQKLFSNMLTLERLKSQNQTHFGFTVANDNKAIIGLNAFQEKDEIFYTLLHELFHLYDPFIKANPSPVDMYLQEVRALLFELRIYIERKKLVPRDSYSLSKFHEEFLITNSEHITGIDWNKLGYYIYTRFFPKPDKNEFIFSAKETDFLTHDSSRKQSDVKTLQGGLIFNDVLLELFRDELKKSKNDQDKTSIVARLLYSLRHNNFDMKKVEQEYDTSRRIINGYMKSLAQDYGYLLDFSHSLPLKRNGINNLSSGGPRPRNEGGP